MFIGNRLSCIYPQSSNFPRPWETSERECFDGPLVAVSAAQHDGGRMNRPRRNNPMYGRRAVYASLVPVSPYYERVSL